MFVRFSFIAVVFHCMSTIDGHFQLWLLWTILWMFATSISKPLCLLFILVYSSGLAGSWGFNMFHLIFFSKFYATNLHSYQKNRLTVFLPHIHFSRSVVSNSLPPHGLQHASRPVHHQLPEFTQAQVHWVSDAIQPSHPLSSPASRVFSSELALHIRWPKYWSFFFLNCLHNYHWVFYFPL